MTSTNDGNDVNINQRSSHKNKSFYIELYKSLEARLNNGESSLEARTAHVCEAWRRVYCLYQHSAPSTHPHLSSWLQRHTAHTVLQSKWAESKNEHVRLTAAIDALVAEVQAAAAGRDLQPWEQLLLQRAEWFKKALQNPWGHPVLKSLINPNGEPVTDQQVLEWLIEERGIVLVTRIRHLVSAGNCDDLALLLASAVMDRARASDKRNPDEPNDKAEPAEDATSFMAVLEREASFTVDVWDLLKDIELVLLLKTDKQQRCIELAKLTPLRYGYTTIERLRSRLETSPRDKKLWKHAKEVATLVTQVIIARCMVLPQCSGVGRAALYCCSRSLARLVPAARLPAVSNTLAAAAATARHLHTFCTALDAQCSSDMKPFICELYIRAITAGTNELEQLKLTKRQSDETVGSYSQMLANWFTQLGALLEQSLRLRAECALTAFSVFPARNYYERVADMPQPHNINTTQDPTPETTSEFGSWANDSRTQSNLVKTSETLQIKQTDQHQANVLSTAVLTEGETLGLEPELCQDLAVLLSGPRVKTLSWDMDREVLLENCRSYMDRTQGGTRAVTTELRFLNLDPREYCHLPEEDDEETGIEKGYEHELQVEAPEEIWQDAFFDAELTESANDSEVELQTTKKKTKTPALFSDEDEDPLSNLADAKREKKKLAKEKRKEQRSKKTQKRDTSKEPSKERRKDKEKKTKKEGKKDKSEQQITGSLTSLLGMKVTKMSSQVQDGEKRVRKKKERRRDSSTAFSYVSVTDSDYDSQEKLSQISDNDPNILVDGVFSMDEIKSPERPERRDSDTKPIDNTSAEFKTFGIAKSTVINDIKTRPTVSSPKVSTSDDSDVSRSKSPYLTPNQLANRHVVSSKVKSSIINKLLQFRRNKQVKPVAKNPASIQTPTIPNQTLVGMKIYNPEEVPKAYMNKKQLETISKEVNNLRNKANEISNSIAPQAYNEPRTDNKLLNLYNVQKQSQDYNAMHGTPLNMNENQKVHTEFIKSPPKLSLHSSYMNQTPAIAHTNYLSPPKIEHTSAQALNLSPQKPIVTYQPYHKSMQNLTGNMPEIPKKPVLINDPNYHSQQAKNASQLSPRIISNTCIKPPNQTVTSSQHDTKLAHMSIISKGIQNLNTQIANLNDAARFAPKLPSNSIHDVNSMRNEVIKKHVPSNDMRYPNTYMKSHSDLVNTALALQASKSTPPSRKQSQDAKIIHGVHATQQKPEIKTHYQEYLNSLAKSMNASVSVTNQSIHLNKDVKLTPVPNSSTSTLYRRADSATPQCAKQMIQQKKESAPNTFSRRSYMHKNKQNETKIINDIIASELNKNIIDHKMMKAQLKHDVTISRVSNSNLKNQTKIVSNIEQPPKNLQKSCPLLSSMLDSPGKLFEKNQPFTNVASSQSLTETQTDREHADLLLLLRNQPIVKTNPSTNVIKSDVTLSHVPSNTHNKIEQVTSAHQTLIGAKVKNINIITPQVEKPSPQHNATDWEDVMNALLAHKTAPLGPNALDMVLKNDKRRSHSTSRSSQKPRTPGQNSHMKPDAKKRENHDTKSKSSILKTSTEKHSEAPKRHRQPEASKKTPTIEMAKRPEIQNKLLSSKEDPFISGIPNSAYDMIGDLMDDDLRRELGELSSDEDAYNSANVSVVNGKCSNTPKTTTNVCKIPNISKENPHIVNPKTIICKNETNTVNRKTSATNICPTVITSNSSHTNATRLPENKTVEQHTASVITNQIAQPNVMTNHIIAPSHYMNNMEPANVIIASLPVQAPPVFVIRQDLAYDPYPTIRIHESQVSAGLCTVNQNLYTVNTTPNIALYQTTQFAAPVINPVIIGNALTSTNVSNSVAMTEGQGSPDSKNDDLPSTQEGIDTSIADRIESNNKTPERPTNLDFNMNKNCARKVLSQMQEKHLNENVDKDSHIRRLPAEEEPLKSTQDEERIKLKRQFLLNRKTNHACDIGPIPLSYTPLNTNVNPERTIKQETLKNGVIKPIAMSNSNNTVETLVSIDSERVDSPQSAANNENIESPTKASSSKKNKKSNRRWLRSSKKSESRASPVKRARVPLRRNKIKQKVTKKGIQDITDLVKEHKDSVKTGTRVSTRILNKNKLKISDSSASTGQQPQMENDEPLDSEDVTPPSPKYDTVLDYTELIDFEEELSGSKILKTSLIETTAPQNDEMDEGMDCEISDEIPTEKDEPLELERIIEEEENNLQDTEGPEALPECKKSTNSDLDPTGVIDKLKNQLGNQLIIKSLPSQKTSLDRNVIIIKNNAIVKPRKRVKLTADGLIKVKTPATTKVGQTNRKDLLQSSNDFPQVNQTLTNNAVSDSKKTLPASSKPSNETITRTDDKTVPDNKRNTRASLLSQKGTVPNAMKVTDTDLVKDASDAVNTNTTTVPEKDSPLDMDKPKSLPESKNMQLPNTDIDEIKTPGLVKNKSRQAKVIARSLLSRGKIEEVFCTEGYPNTYAREEETDMRQSANCQPNNSNQTLNDIPKNTVESKAAVSKNNVNLGNATNEVKEYPELTKDNVKIEEIRSHGSDPNAKTFRIKLPNGKVINVTISGKVNGDFDSLFSQPTIRSILEEGLKDGKKYTVKYTQILRVNKENQSTLLATKIQNIKIKDLTPVDTVNLISDEEDEIDTPRAFVTEFGKYATNVDQEIFTQHQKKFSQKCVVKLQKAFSLDTKDTKRQPNFLPASNSSLLTRTRSRLISQTTATNVIPKSKSNDECIPVSVDLTDNSQTTSVETMPSPNNSLMNSDEPKLLSDATTSDIKVECNNKNNDVSLTTADMTIKPTPANETTAFKASDPENSVECSAMELCLSEMEPNAADTIPAEDYNTNDDFTDAPTPNAPSEPNNTSEVVNTTEISDKNTDILVTEQISLSEEVFNDTPIQANTTEVPVIDNTDKLMQREITPTSPMEVFNDNLKKVNATEVEETSSSNTCESLPEQTTPGPSVEGFNYSLNLVNATEVLVNYNTNKEKSMLQQILSSPSVEVCNDILKEVETTKVEKITPLLMEVTDDTPEVVNTTGIVETTKVITPLLMEITDDTPEVVNTTGIVETTKVEDITPLLMEATDDTSEVVNTTGIVETTKVEDITPLLMEVTDDTPEVVNTTEIVETNNSKTNKLTLSPTHSVKASNDITEMTNTTEIVQIDNTNTDKLIPEQITSPSVELSNDTDKEVNTSEVEEITPTLLMEVYDDTPSVKTTKVVEMQNSNTDKLMSEQIILVPPVAVSSDSPKVTETTEGTEIKKLNSDKLISEEITPNPSVGVSNDTLPEVNTTEVVEINHSNTGKLVPKEITTSRAVEVYNDTTKETNATKVEEIDNSNTDKIEQITPSSSVGISNDNLKVVNAVEIPETDEAHADNLIPEQRTNERDISEVGTADVVEIEYSNIEEIVPKQITPSLSTEVSNDTSKAADTVEVIEIDDSSNDSVEIITSDKSESIEPAKKIYELSDILLQEYGIKVTNGTSAYPRKKKAAVYNFKNALLQDLGIVPTVTPVIDITNDDDDIEITTPQRPVLPKCYVKLTRCDNLIKRYKLMKTMKRCYVKLERLDTVKMASTYSKSKASTNETHGDEQRTRQSEDLIEFDVEGTTGSPQLSRCPSLSILNDWECEVTPQISCPNSPVMEIFDTIVQLHNELGGQSELVIKNKELFSLKCDSEWTMTKLAFRTIHKITQTFFMQAVPLTECQNIENDDEMPIFKAPNLLTITLKFLEANPDLICRLHSTHKLNNQLISSPNKLKRKTIHGSEGTVANKISKLGTLALNVWYSNPQIIDAYNYTKNKKEMKGKEHYEIDVPITNAQYTNRHCNIKNCDLTTEFGSAISTEIDDKPQNTCEIDLKIHENHPVLASPDSNAHSNSDIIEENIQHDKITEVQVSSYIEDKKEETIEIEEMQSGKIETNEKVTDSHIVDALVTNKNDRIDIDADKNLSVIEELNDSSTNIQAISEKTVNIEDLNTSTLDDIKQFSSEKSKNIETEPQVNATNEPITEDILSIENCDSDTEQDSRASSPSLLANLTQCSNEEMEQRTHNIEEAPVSNKNDQADIDADKNLSVIEELNDSLTKIQAISKKTVSIDDLNTSTLDIEQFGSEESINIETETQVNATNEPITEDILSIENSDSDTEQGSRASSPSLLDNLPQCSNEEMEQRTDNIEKANTESSNTINAVMDEISVEDLSDEAYLVEIVVSHEEDEADIIQSIIANQELVPVNIDSSSNHKSSLKSPVFVDSNKIVFNYHDYTKMPKNKENTTDTGDFTQKDNASDDVQTVCNPESNIDLNDHSEINYTSEHSQLKAKPERKYELIQEDDLLTVITTENDKEDDEINPVFENSSDSSEDTAIVASVCSNNASIKIKGFEYDDVYVFPLSETGSNASNDSINQEFNISVNKRLNDIKNELHDIDFGVIEPRVTYTRKSLKRKIGMRDVKVLAKKYRKGKNIDCPRQTYTSMMESAYSKEYKLLLEYCSSVKFSYARPFHKECLEIDDLVSEWPINGACDGVTDELEDEHLFVNLEEIDSFQPDPATQTLAEEISYEYEQNDAIQEKPSSVTDETNFNMGFGEGSGRVIQNLKKEGESNISAATLSDVKQSQPVLKSVDFDDSNNLKTREEDQLKKIRQHVNFIELRDKVRSFFKKCSFELKYDWIQQNFKDFQSTNNDRLHAEQFPFDLCSLEYVKPLPTETIVQVVQVGQLPVSAAAQNPVTCDPRVTQVSDASPSQCSVDNSPNDDSQSEIKTEYTELTTADLTLPLQEYAQQNQAMNLTSHDDNIEIREQTISLEMEIKAEESPEIKEEMPDIKDEKSNSSDTELHTLTNATPDHMEYAYKNNNDKSETASVIYETPEQNESEAFPQQRKQNGTSEKTDQIAHAMNAAGITTTPETVTNTRAHALVNILSQKIRHGSVNTTQTTTNTYSKTTSINAMALQQALAQILPPPLNQTGSGENNQTSSTNVGPQVLHIVQGKNASGNQITLVDNSQQSVISAPNTQVLHIVQNKGAASGQASNGTLTPQTNSFSGLSLVDAGLQQGGNQLLHIVNTGNQKNASPGQLLKRVNLLTNLQGSNEQKMVQFVCKSADGKAIQLNAPHQRSMVLRLQPIETPNVQTSAKSSESQELSQSPTNSASKDNASQQEIKSRSIYEENYAKFIQNSSTKTPGSEKSTSLPKFNQAFGKPVFQEGTQKQGEATSNNLPSVNTNSENAECPANDNAINLEHIGQISSPPLLLRKQAAVTSQSQSNIVQQIKQTIAPMNIQTMHGGVIYTRQIPVNIGGGQTINLITVPSTELINDDAPKTQTQNSQGEIEPSIIKIVPQSQNTTSTESTQEDSNNQSNGSNENAQTPQPQPVLTQMRIKLPMLSKAPQMVPGARVVRPSFFQIQRNVIGGANQPVYQQLVLTAAPPLGQQTIRLPTAQASRTIKVHSDSQSSSSESQMSSSTLEQLREFDMVLEQVKERSTVQPGTNSNSNFKIHTSSSDTTDGNASSNCSTESTPQQVLYSIGNNQSLNVAYVNRKATVTTPTTSTYVRSPDSSGIADSPTSSTHGQIPHTVTSDSSPTEMSSQSKPAKVGSKSKSRPKSTSNPPNTLKLNSVPPKTSSQKPLEDEQTTQRILYILAEYKEQVENSPDKDKPAPRRRSNPPSNPGSSKRKKSSSSRRSGTRDMSPVHGEDTCRTMGSEDSSCGTSQGDCNESCLDSHSPQDSPRKVARKITFDQDLNVTQPRPQPQRNVIVADGQTITVARGTTGKPATAVLMPANYILPVSMVKGGQQIAIVTNRGPKLLTVGGEGGATNALLLQRLIGPAGLKPVLARPGVRHVRLPTAALHNLQAFNLATATTVQPPDSTASPTPGPTPPELVDTRATSSPWTDRGDSHDVKPERGSSPEGSEPWNLPSSADHEYTYEETVRTENMDRTVLVVQKKDGSQRQHRIGHVSAAALRHKYAILEHELRLQKSLSEECEDLGVDSPSASELFPEAELLFATSPAHEHNQDPHHEHTPQPLQSTIPQPDMDDQIATDHLIPREIDIHGLGDVGIVAVSSDGMQTTIALDQEEFARSHPNTTFHSEPTDGEVQPFTITGLKGRHITSTIFHSNSAPATVLMAAPQATVISQAPDHSVKYQIENMINSMPSSHNNDINLSSVLVKDDGLTRFDNILTDSRELHLTNTASAIVHSSGNATQVIRRVCYEDDKRERDTRFLIDEPDNLIAGDDAKMVAEDSSRDATLESMADVDDDRSSPERHAELFWESNSASERSESRRPLDFSSDSDKCCKSPSFDETNSTDSSGVGTHMRLDSVIKEARGRERSGSADGSSADDTHPPLRTYPPKRMYHPLEGEVERSLSGKTRAGERSPDSLEVRRRASGRGVVKRGCHCCNGSPAPPRPKKPRQRKPTLDFTANN